MLIVIRLLAIPFTFQSSDFWSNCWGEHADEGSGEFGMQSAPGDALVTGEEAALEPMNK
jgi:hypothetical protein